MKERNDLETRIHPAFTPQSIRIHVFIRGKGQIFKEFDDTKLPGRIYSLKNGVSDITEIRVKILFKQAIESVILCINFFVKLLYFIFLKHNRT